MNTKLLVEGIMQQTTVLIAQLSTAAGIRAPLAHVADRVFLDLAREIEAQGVGRKVVADMFGMALRTYQKRVQRLTESTSARGKTLWQGVLDALGNGPVTRRRLRIRFEYDGEAEVGAVLNDLQNSGLIYCSGRGDNAIFGLTSAEDRRALLELGELDALSGMIWLHVHLHEPLSPEDVVRQFSSEPELTRRALQNLLNDGTLLTDVAGRLRSVNFVVPVGSEVGWEAAVFDHFRAMVTAIAAKVRQGRTQAQHSDVVGGATLAFQVHDQHPHRDAVFNLLQETRARVGALWTLVREHNQASPVEDDAATTVTFYFGQNVNAPTTAHENSQS